MLPLGAGAPPAMVSSITPEMQEKLQKIKFCVVGIFVAAVGRLCTGDIPFNELLCGINGVFLLKDDESLGACYACLLNSPVGQCAGPGGGGLACLMPFLFIASFNCIFLTMRLFVAGPFLFLSFCFQLGGAVLAFKLNSLISANALAELGSSGQAQPLTQPLTPMLMRGAGGGYPDQGGAGTAGAPPGALGPGGGRFVAFQGAGQRLGD